MLAPLICRTETRDMADPLAIGRVFTMGVPDGFVHVEAPDLGVDEPIRVRVVHVDVPGQTAIKGAYLRTDRMEWTLVVAEADRFVGFGEQRLFAAVRDQVLARHHEKQIAVHGKMPDMRPGGYSQRAKPIQSYVPRSFPSR